MKIYLRKRVREELSPLFEMYIRPFEDQIGILWFYDLDVFLKALGAPLFDAKVEGDGPHFHLCGRGGAWLEWATCSNLQNNLLS